MAEDSKGQTELNLSHLARRDVLRAGVATTIPAVLAGCSGSNDEDDTSTTTGTGNDDDSNGEETDVSTPNERVDTRFVMPNQPNGNPIPQTNWNVFNAGGYPWAGYDKGRITHVEFQIYSPQTGEEHMVLGDSWELVDDTTLRQTFKDDIQWWDGTEITTDDIAVEERINDALVEISDDFTPSDYIEDWSIVDDKTWEYSLADSFSEDFVRYGLVKGSVEVKADVYESWADELEALIDDGDQEGAEERVTELLEHRIPNEEIYGNGPFKYKDHDDTRFITEVNEDYVYSDNIHFTEYVWKDFENQAEAFISGNVDAVKWTPNSNQQNRAPEFHWTDKLRQTGTGVHLNMGMFDMPSSDAAEGVYDPITKEPDGWLVRKAVAYAIDPEQTARAWHEEAEPLMQPQSNYPYAMYDNDEGPVSREWIDENLEDYSAPQPEKAREMLKEAGLTWDGDEETWLNWDDEPIEVVILSKPDPGRELVVKKNLEDIGLNVTLNASESFGSDRWEGEFDMMPDTGTGTGPSIYASFPKTGWQGGMYHGPSGYNEEYGWPVPMPIGNTDVTDPSEREKFVPVEAFNEYVKTGDSELVKELMWSSNQFLPTADYAKIANTGSINAERWEVDGPDSLLHSGSRNGFYNILKHSAGTLAPREDSDYHN